MNRWHAFGQLVLNRLRGFYREPAAFFWVYIFPILLAVALAIAFSNRKPEAPAVDVVRGPSPGESARLAGVLRDAEINAAVVGEEDARGRYRTGKTALVVSLAGSELTFGLDPTRAESVAARHQVEAAVRRWKSPDALAVAERLETEPGNRYIDFLLPGLMGMNILGGGLWGVGFVLADLRVRKLLKRLIATPMRRGDFLLSLLAARLILLAPEMLALYAVGRLLFGVPMRGGPLTLVAVMLVGAMAANGLGLLVACRSNKAETVIGLINLTVLPMWLLSGVFFSSKKFPDAVQPLIQALPLTQINDGLREVMLEGRSLPEVAWRLAILAAYAVVCFTLALRLFRWQ